MIPDGVGVRRPLAETLPMTVSSSLLRWVSIAAFIAFAWGCSQSPDPEVHCDAHPAFVVLVTVPTGTLPANTTITITFGGSGTEMFELGADGPHHALFCDWALRDGTKIPQPDAATDGAAPLPEALSCELWTGGAANITIEGDGYQPILNMQLEAKNDASCGFKTVNETLTLAPMEGGTR